MEKDELAKGRDRITIRLGEKLLREVERIAERELTPPTVLMRRWINERALQYDGGSSDRITQ